MALDCNLFQYNTIAYVSEMITTACYQALNSPRTPHDLHIYQWAVYCEQFGEKLTMLL